MVEYFNKRANLSGNVPLGSFNAAFSFTGSKHLDAANTKTLCTDGYFIPLAKFEITKSSLILQESVKRAVPTSWDPPALARYTPSCIMYKNLISFDLTLPLMVLLLFFS